MGLGMVYTQLKEFAKARDILLIALKINLFNRDTRFYLGKAYYGLGNLDQAIRQTEKALEIDPGDPETHFTLGLYYDKKGWADMAVAEYRETQLLDPDYIIEKVAWIQEKGDKNTEERDGAR